MDPLLKKFLGKLVIFSKDNPICWLSFYLAFFARRGFGIIASQVLIFCACSGGLLKEYYHKG